MSRQGADDLRRLHGDVPVIAGIIGSPLSRRRLLGSTIGIAALLCGERVWAQRGVLAKFAATAVQLRPQAAKLLNDVQEDLRKKPLPLPDWREKQFIDADYNQRLSLTMAGQGLTNDDFRTNGKFHEPVRSGMKPWANQFVGHNIPLVPALADIKRFSGGPEPRIPAKPKSKPDLFDVVIDIILDALDLLEARETFREIMRQLPGSEECVEKISKAMKESRQDAVADGIFNFLRHLFEWDWAKTWVDKLPPNLKVKLLARLGVRLVPFFGWGYLLVALALSTNRHWERLRAAA